MLTHPHDTIIGDIPEDWESKPLRSLLESQSSGDWGADEGEEPITVIRSTNFTNSGVLDLSDVATRYFTAEKAATFSLLKGDVLVERSGGGPDQPVGRVAFVPEDMDRTTVSNFVQILRPDPSEVDPEFFGWVLYELQRTGMTERVQQQSTQMRNLQWRDYQRLLLPWPDLREQRRITKALKTADAAIIAACGEWKATHDLKRSLMSELFSSGIPGRHQRFEETRIGRVPATWAVKKVKDILIGRPTNGYSPQSKPEPPGTKTVNVSCIRNGECDLSKVTYVDIDDSVIQALQVHQEDFFILRGNGNRDYIGIGGLVRDSVDEKMIYSDLLFRMPFDTDQVVPRFVPYLWQTTKFLHRLQAKAKSGSGLWKIGKRDIENEWIPIPPEPEQNEIVQAIEAVISASFAAERNVASLEEAKKALLQNLLTGKTRILDGGV